MFNHNSPIIRENAFLYDLKNRHNETLCLRFSESLLHFQIEDIVYMRDEDIPFHFKILNFLASISLAFPLASSLTQKPTLSKEKVSI